MADFSRVRAVVGEPDPQAREIVRSTLFGLGFREITDTPSLAKVHQTVRRTAADLLIFNANMDGDDTAFVTTGIRSGKLGDDPFPVIIVLITSLDAARLRAIIDSGADDALILPFAADALCKKVADLSGARKPFVVTCDYIGPERRSGPRPGSQSGNLVEIPNPLAFRAIGADDAYAAARDLARANVYRERTIRLAVQIEWLAKAIYDAASKDEDLFPFLRRIEDFGKELMHQNGNLERAEMITRLLSEVKTIRSSANIITVDALERLRALAAAIAVQVPSST